MSEYLFHGDLVTSNRILYTPSAFARTNLLHLQEIGELQARRPHTSGRTNLQSYLFFIVLEGTGSLQYGDMEYALAKGDCVFIDCKKPYAHCSSEQLWQLSWVHFYGPNMNNIYEKYVERGGHPCFHPKERGRYDKILKELYKIADSDAYIKDMQIFEKLTGLLTFLMEDSWNPHVRRRKTSTKAGTIQHVKDYLDSHYEEKILLDDLSERFFINKFYLTRSFKEQFGVPVNTYLLQNRITHAKQLLRFSELPIEVIGQKCGMQDANYFSRMFRKVEGVSPGEYRKLW